MRKKKVIWIRQKQKDDGMIWYVCKNSLGEDTIISDMKDVRVNDSSNQGTFFISFNGDMVQTKYGIRSFKYLRTAKAWAERLIRRGRRLGTHV